MPYIKPEYANLWDDALDSLFKEIKLSGADRGDLNYIFSKICEFQILQEGISYNTLSSTKSALTDAAAEFQRRLIDRYEDIKIKDNGDIYQEAISRLSKLETPRND